jgi:LysM repeat protein
VIAAAPVPEVDAPVADAPEVVATEEPEVIAETATDVAEPPEPLPAPPTFDIVRVETDGAALVAGTAPKDAQVSLRLDGFEETRVQADGDGKFVAQFTLAPNPAPRLLGVVALLADGTLLPGAATVAIAPIAAPPPVATADVADAPATPEPPAAILLTDTGAEVIQGPETIAPADTSAGDTDTTAVLPIQLDTIAYGPDGEVQLSGRGEADAKLRIYLDTVPKLDGSINGNGKWAVTMADVAPGVYTMRLDQLADDGSVTSRFETPFKRETLEALANLADQTAAVDAPPVVAQAPDAEPAPEPPIAPEPLPQVAEAATAPVAPVELPAEPVAAPAPSVPAELPAEPANLPATTVAPETVAPVTITVQPGFTLWAIAEDRFGKGTMYVQVFEANRDKIRDPDLIYPGQVFSLPQE